jgi:hypothetical protein
LDMDWSQLRLGFRLGMCTILLLILDANSYIL